MHPSALPNMFLRLVKWPIAITSLAMLPLLPSLLYEHLWEPLSFSECEHLLFGAGIYAAAWLLFFRTRIAGSYLSTFEHELTHAIFAWATLHRVTGLKVTWRDGGTCTFVGSGGGNWLISIAPYWFPTLSVIPLLALLFVEAESLVWVHGSLGFVLLYHLTSTWRETHREQSDLKETSWLFAAMFLPSANLLVYALILCAALRGSEASSALLADLAKRSGELMIYLAQLSTQL